MGKDFQQSVTEKDWGKNSWDVSGQKWYWGYGVLGEAMATLHGSAFLHAQLSSAISLPILIAW